MNYIIYFQRRIQEGAQGDFFLIQGTDFYIQA